MIKTLKWTNAQEIQNALTDARHNVGSASGLVFTLLVITDLHDYSAVLDACVEAGREHPSRLIIVTNGMAKADRLDAEVHIGEDVPGEIISLRFQGELANHRETVVLPLLLADSPVIAWWPGAAPASLRDDPLGALANRRITDAMGAQAPLQALELRAHHMTPGDADLTWTRLTPWRALLVSALDQYPEKVTKIEVTAEPNNAAGVLLAAWLDDRLPCPVTVSESEVGLGVTSVIMSMEGGDISIRRVDGRMATYSAPKTPKRIVALRRRSVSQLLTEELRRMDTDEVLQSTMKQLLRRTEKPERQAVATVPGDEQIAKAKDSQIE